MDQVEAVEVLSDCGAGVGALIAEHDAVNSILDTVKQMIHAVPVQAQVFVSSRRPEVAASCRT